MKTEFDISIIEYLGKVDGGVLVLLGVVYRGEYFEATFFYNENDILLTISEELESITGPIKEHPSYIDILRDIIRKIVPYDEMYNRIDPVDFSRWVKPTISVSDYVPQKIDPSEIKTDTE